VGILVVAYLTLVWGFSKKRIVITQWHGPIIIIIIIIILIIIIIITALLLHSIHTGEIHHRYRSGPLKNKINIKCNYIIVRQL
jgi:hypothetical protein